MNPKQFKQLQREWLEKEHPEWSIVKKRKFTEACELTEKLIKRVSRLGFLVVVIITQNEKGKLVNYYGMQEEKELLKNNSDKEMEK